MRPRTLVKHRDLREHSEAHRCCRKLLMGSALVRCGVRQQRGRNLFPSVLLQPLGHLSVSRINRLRAVEHLIIAHASLSDGPASIAFRFSSLRASVARRRSNCVRPLHLSDDHQRFRLPGVGLADDDFVHGSIEKMIIHRAAAGFLRPVDRNLQIAKMEA